MATVEFTVHIKEIHPWDNVFVVGSHTKIGLWDPNLALELVPDEQSKIWTNKIALTIEESKKSLQYRYFIGFYLQSSNDPTTKKKIVSKWEAQFLPRTLFSAVHMKTGIDEFGFYNGRSKISNGWLHQQNQCEFLLRFHGKALKFFKERYNLKIFSIKVVAFDLRHKEVGSIDDDETDFCETPTTLPQLPSFSNIEVADLSGNSPLFKDQNSNGTEFQNERDFLIFRIKSIASEFLAFRFEFYYSDDSKNSKSESCENNEKSSSNKKMKDEKSEIKRIAIAYCMPTSMPDTFGIFSVPILAKNQQPIGLLNVDYLLVKSLDPMINQSMEVSFSKHWKKRIPLEIGHRGSGNSYTKFAAARENTIHSLNRAARNGADFVEFDVQLTKDKIAVIFHDFHVLVSIAKRSTSTMDLKNIFAEKFDSGVTEFYELAVKDLKLNQLRLLHLDHHKAPENRDKLRVTGDAQEAAELEPFPTLVEALKNVDMDTGFNIEVKYPLKMKDGVHECENFFERNAFIDVILNDVYANAEKRRIVFSSFDPDICTLIALKQHKYPVLFLSVGETKRYVPFLDERTCTSKMAVNFAVSQDILGVNLHSECLLIDPSPVRKAKEYGLVAFVWGDDLDDRENVKKMKELGLDGIIYDRIGEVEARKNVFIVEKDARKSLFASSPIPSRSGSMDKGTYTFRTMDIAIPTKINGINNVGSGSSSSSSTNTPKRARTPSSPKKTGKFNEI